MHGCAVPPPLPPPQPASPWRGGIGCRRRWRGLVGHVLGLVVVDVGAGGDVLHQNRVPSHVLRRPRGSVPQPTTRSESEPGTEWSRPASQPDLYHQPPAEASKPPQPHESLEVHVRLAGGVGLIAWVAPVPSPKWPGTASADNSENPCGRVVFNKRANLPITMTSGRALSTACRSTACPQPKRGTDLHHLIVVVGDWYVYWLMEDDPPRQHSHLIHQRQGIDLRQSEDSSRRTTNK